MSKLDDSIANVAYILDSLIALRNIHETGSCNDCGMQKTCGICPNPGEMVRYNCPMYVKQEVEHE